MLSLSVPVSSLVRIDSAVGVLSTRSKAGQSGYLDYMAQVVDNQKSDPFTTSYPYEEPDLAS